jgi:hypothetical protein
VKVGRREFPQTTSEGSSSAERRPVSDIGHALIFSSRSIRRISFYAEKFCERIVYRFVMFEIRHNGVPRSYRDKKDVAFEAARFAKQRAKGDIIEIVDLATGTKMVIFEDGRGA